MGVDVKDLPPAYQAQALRKWAEQERRKKRQPLPCPADTGPEKPTKYHNKPTERVTPTGAVLRFDSQKEARRYDELAALERAGTIRELRMQVDFTLQEAYTDGEGRRVRAIRYRADFSYKKRPKYWTGYECKCPDDGWILVVEEENLCAMFDIQEKRRKKCILTRKPMPESLDVEDYAKGERALYDEWPTVEHNGYVVKPLSTNDDMLFIQTAYLSPLEDMADYLRFYERVDTTGQKYIVAKNGMEIAGVIMLVDTIRLGFVEKLEALAHKCRVAVEKQEEREREKAMRREPGPLFREGGDAGEGEGE